MKEKLLSKGKKYDNMGMIEVGGGNMKRSKGFTLIELLAVIVILAIIALIATPIILSIINDSREKSNQRSIEGLAKATETTIGEIMMGSDYTGSDIVCKNTEYMTATEKEYMNTKEKETYCWDIDNPEGTIKQVTYSGARVIASTITFNKETGRIAIAGAQVGSSSKVYSTESDNSLIGTIASLAITNNEDWIFTDTYGNIRYRGSNPNNYVTFNDELWRIIGIVDGNVKLIKAIHLPEEKPWDEEVNGYDFVNDWSNASLQIYLNGEYYNSLSKKSQEMIEISTWKLGGAIDSEITPKQAYEYEREATVYTGDAIERPSEWIGKIALMYGSDYGYATMDTCEETLENYDNDTCTINNWLFSGKWEWLLNTDSDYQGAWSLFQKGNVISEEEVYVSYWIRPALNLKSDVKITGGSGTREKPYQLSL